MLSCATKQNLSFHRGVVVLVEAAGKRQAWVNEGSRWYHKGLMPSRPSQRTLTSFVRVFIEFIMRVFYTGSVLVTTLKCLLLYCKGTQKSRTQCIRKEKSNLRKEFLIQVEATVSPAGKAEPGG